MTGPYIEPPSVPEGLALREWRGVRCVLLGHDRPALPYSRCRRCRKRRGLWR